MKDGYLVDSLSMSIGLFAAPSKRHKRRSPFESFFFTRIHLVINRENIDKVMGRTHFCQYGFGVYGVLSERVFFS